MLVDQRVKAGITQPFLFDGGHFSPKSCREIIHTVFFRIWDMTSVRSVFLRSASNIFDLQDFES